MDTETCNFGSQVPRMASHHQKKWIPPKILCMYLDSAFYFNKSMVWSVHGYDTQDLNP